jgi:orotate phosphoribosyltransferase-like protein
MNKYFAKYIKRDSNPNRKYAFIIDGFGKIDNLSNNLYKDFSNFVNKNIDLKNDEKIIVFGPSESGIFLAKYIYNNLYYKNKIYIYSNLRSRTIDNKYTIKFKENHCINNNIHSFTFNYEKYYDYKSLIIIEDEITSGNTIINLINSVSKYFKNIYIYTLLDRREKDS